MIKIAIVTHGALPIPSVKGGGAETLVDQILIENEKKPLIYFTVYSVYDKKAQEKINNYKYADFVFLNSKKDSLISKMKRFLNRLIKGIRTYPEPIDFKKIKRDLSKKEFDYILLENTIQPFVSYVKKFGTKIILHEHNDFINGGLSNKYKKTIENTIKNCGAVLTVSKYLKDRIEELNIDGKKIYVLKNCTDLKPFSSLNSINKDDIKSKFSIGKNDFVLLFIGRICPEKGLLELVKGFNRIKNQDNIKLLIVGSAKSGENITNNYTKRVFEEINKNKDRIIFTGYIDYSEIYKVYGITDVVVIPSVWEDPAPLTVFESMAAGKPIITTGSGGISEYANHSFAVFCKRSKELPELLSNAIMDLYENKEKIIDFGEKAKEESKKYSTQAYYRDFKNIIFNLEEKRMIEDK